MLTPNITENESNESRTYCLIEAFDNKKKEAEVEKLSTSIESSKYELNGKHKSKLGRKNKSAKKNCGMQKLPKGINRKEKKKKSKDTRIETQDEQKSLIVKVEQTSSVENDDVTNDIIEKKKKKKKNKTTDKKDDDDDETGDQLKNDTKKRRKSKKKKCEDEEEEEEENGDKDDEKSLENDKSKDINTILSNIVSYKRMILLKSPIICQYLNNFQAIKYNNKNMTKQ